MKGIYQGPYQYINSQPEIGNLEKKFFEMQIEELNDYITAFLFTCKFWNK
jgi:hypothetical protein